MIRAASGRAKWEALVNQLSPAFADMVVDRLEPPDVKEWLALRRPLGDRAAVGCRRTTP